MPKMKLPKGAEGTTPSVADFAMGGPLASVGPNATKLIQGFFQNVLGGEMDVKRAWQAIQMLGASTDDLHAALDSFPVGTKTVLRNHFGLQLGSKTLPPPSHGVPKSSLTRTPPPLSIVPRGGPREARMKKPVMDPEMAEYLGLKK